MKTYNKLVRDRIPEIIQADGKNFETVLLDDQEYLQELLAKLVEEAKEVQEATPDKRSLELSDLREVMEAIMKYENISSDEVMKIQMNRKTDRGAFEKRIKLLWTD